MNNYLTQEFDKMHELRKIARRTNNLVKWQAVPTDVEKDAVVGNYAFGVIENEKLIINN